MQLSVPTFPFPGQPAPTANASAARPADGSASNGTPFGDFLTAQSRAASPRSTGLDNARRPADAGVQALAKPDAVVDADGSAIADDSATTPEDESLAPTAVGIWLPAEGAAQPLLTDVNVLALGANLTLPSQLEAGSNEIATSDDCDVTSDVPVVAAASGNELTSTNAAFGFPLTASLTNAVTAEPQIPNSPQSDLAEPAETSAVESNNSGFPLKAQVDASSDAAPTADAPTLANDGANPVVGDSTDLSISESASPVSVAAQAVSDTVGESTQSADLTGVPTVQAVSDTVGESTQLADLTDVPTESATEGLVAVPLDGETTGAGMVESSTPGHPLGRSASATAIRVHAAIEQARSLNIPPASLIAEKFAASGDRVANGVRPEEPRGQIKSIDIAVQQVASSYVNVGINVAKAESAMPAPTTFTPSPTDAIEAVSFTPAAISFESLVNTDTANPALASGARRAVESAVAISERFASSDRSSVNLQFNVSGVDLAVRVEMRADGVHTTFRTDSPELRAALAQEWQSVTAQTPDRAVRLAEPTFSSSGSGSGLQSDAGSSHQQQSGARETPSFAGMFPTGRTFNRVAPVATTTTSLPVTVAAATGRLHTFA